MQIKGQYTQADLREAFKHPIRKTLLPYLYFLLGIFFGYSLFLNIVTKTFTFFALCNAFFFLFFVFPSFRRWLVVYLRFHFQDLASPTVYQITDKGIEFEKKTMKSFLKWSAFANWRSDQYMAALSLAPNQGQIIIFPRRFFSGKQWPEFLRLVQEKVQKQPLPKSTQQLLWLYYLIIILFIFFSFKLFF